MELTTSENMEHSCGTHHIGAYTALQQNSQTLQYTCTRYNTPTEFTVSELVQSLRTTAVDECIQAAPVNYFRNISQI